MKDVQEKTDELIWTCTAILAIFVLGWLIGGNH